MRSHRRVCDVSINTVAKLLKDAGEACAAYHYRDGAQRRCQARPVR